MKLDNKNLYLPVSAVIKEAIDMRGDVKLFKIKPEQKMDYTSGQFLMVSTWGAGEVPISISSTKGLQQHIELCIKNAGFVTSILCQLKAGDKLWLRGPYGKGFSTDVAKKRDVIFVAGGIGIVPLRSLINLLLIQKKHYGKLFLVYGSKNSREILFIEDVQAWEAKGLEIIMTVDEKDNKWKGNVGLVTEYLDKVRTDFKKACAFVCGPDIMIKAVMKKLFLMGIPESRIVTTFEARMKCGIGKCGQCYAGGKYVCTDGPVFTYKMIKRKKIYGP